MAACVGRRGPEAQRGPRTQGQLALSAVTPPAPILALGERVCAAGLTASAFASPRLECSCPDAVCTRRPSPATCPPGPVLVSEAFNI